MAPSEFRLIHKPSQSVVLITFSVVDNKISIATVRFIKGNVIDLIELKRYAKFELNKQMSAACANE